jgi:hypothetical protein
MYSLEQLQNVTLQQVKDDPVLKKALAKMYFGAGARESDGDKLIKLWEDGTRSFNRDRDFAVSSFTSSSDNSELARNVDRYINWNNSAKPEDQQAAFKEREMALQALDAKSKQLAEMGIDIKSIPQYAQFYTQLGETPGAGQTSAQTAEKLGQTTVNLPDEPVRTISDIQGGEASVGTYKPSQASVGTYQPSQSSVGTYKPASDPTSPSYVYDTGHLGSKANDAAVNQLYNSYFGRNATAAELANWGDKGTSTVKQLEDFLQAERVKYNYTAPVKSLAGNTIITNPVTNTTAQTSIISNIPFKAGLNDAQKQSIIDLTSKPVASWTQTDKDNWNYATNNTAIPGLATTTPTSTTQANSSIPFKSGLNDAQKASITALANKPSAEWTQTDKDNWNYATNNAPVPGATNAAPSSGKSIYRIGTDIYDAETNQKIPNVETLLRDYAGAKEVAAPGNNNTTTKKATLYGPDGKTEVVDVGSARASELQSQGWGLTPGSYNAGGNTNSSTGKATLYGPDGKSEIVDIGSARASELQSQGWGLTPGSYKAPTSSQSGTGTNNSGTGNGTGSTTGTTNEISAEDKKWINDLYQKYFDRTATSAEIANWASSTPAALDQFLIAEQKKYGYVSNAQKAVQSDKLKAALAIIDASNLPDEIKALWRQTVSLYPDATDFQPQQIIDTFNKIKTETVDPYFKELTSVAIGDINTAFNTMKDARTAELEAQRYTSADAIRQAQTGLEKSGMTFTGKGIESLGASSAYAQNGDGTTPNQIGFAGMPGIFYEGNVNQQNRLLATSTAARYAAQQQQLGRAAEDKIGSANVALAAPGLQYTPGGVNLTGSLEQEKQSKYASTLQGIIENWKVSQNLKTNI